MKHRWGQDGTWTKSTAMTTWYVGVTKAPGTSERGEKIWSVKKTAKIPAVWGEENQRSRK